ELIQVPLVIVHPERLRAGQRSAYYASTHDLARTILSMAGVSAAPRMAGADLSALFGGREPPPRAFAYGGYSDSHFLRDERWAYMSKNDGEHAQLFDLEADPRELRDVALEHPDLVAELRATVEERAGGPLQAYT
ncbi:MAG: sulfatase/phosphatase domain-containing protein, partial [Thermoleophilaceae bacterium]